MSTPTADRRPRYSYFDQLLQKMTEVANVRIRRLSAEDIKAVMLWLEDKQVHRTIEVAIQDEALLSAKARGGIELIDDLNGELLAILGEITKPERAEEGEVDTDV